MPTKRTFRVDPLDVSNFYGLMARPRKLRDAAKILEALEWFYDEIEWRTEAKDMIERLKSMARDIEARDAHEHEQSVANKA